MKFVSPEQAVSEWQKCKSELKTWRCFSTGLFFGCFIIANVLGKWAGEDRYGEYESLIGEKVTFGLIVACIAAYYLRKRALDMRLSRAWSDYYHPMPPGDEKDEAYRIHRNANYFRL